MKLRLPNLQSRISLDAASKAIAAMLYLSCTALLVWIIFRWLEPVPQVAPSMQTIPSTNYQVDHSPEARLLGVETAGGLTPPSVTLFGVFANTEGQGAAVLSIEGQPAHSRTVGEAISNGWVLEEVGPTYATLGRGGQRHQIDLPLTAVDGNLLREVPPGQ